ncbi:MAG: hypothetical protein LBE36_01535 [Flavobacteriaceae bacterium]|jgi:hypothetical protein|nr:hypothetical protein [Flavobacteriaceae bacterium]
MTTITLHPKSKEEESLYESMAKALKTPYKIDANPSLPKKKLSDFAGTLSHETAEAMQKYVAESRNEWEERINKQF